MRPTKSTSWFARFAKATAIVTFLMVFLIQNAQYRDAEAVQVKLDELLRVSQGAHNALLDLEELEEPDLEMIRASRRNALAAGGRSAGNSGTTTPPVRGERGARAAIPR